MKAAEKEGKATQKGEKVTVELQQNVQRACRWMLKKGKGWGYGRITVEEMIEEG